MFKLKKKLIVLPLASGLLLHSLYSFPIFAGEGFPQGPENNCSSVYKRKIRELDQKLIQTPPLSPKEQSEIKAQSGEMLYILRILNSAFIDDETNLFPFQEIIADDGSSPIKTKTLVSLLKLGSHYKYFCSFDNTLDLKDILHSLRNDLLVEFLDKFAKTKEKFARTLNPKDEGALRAWGSCKLPPNMQNSLSTFLGGYNPQQQIINVMRENVEKNPKILEDMTLSLNLKGDKIGGLIAETKAKPRAFTIIDDEESVNDKTKFNHTVTLYEQIFSDYNRDKGEINGPLGKLIVDPSKEPSTDADPIVKKYFLSLWRNLQSDPYLQKKRESFSKKEERDEFAEQELEVISQALSHNTQTFDQKLVSFFLNSFSWLVTAKERKYHFEVKDGKIFSDVNQLLIFRDFENIEKEIPFKLMVKRRVVFDLLRDTVDHQVFEFKIAPPPAPAVSSK